MKKYLHSKLWFEIMKKTLFSILFIIAVISCKAQNTDELIARNSDIDTLKVLEPSALHSKVNKIVTTVLTKAHYKKFTLNDSLSSQIFDNYLKVLDNNKLYFLQSDIDGFEKHRYLFDDYLRSGNLIPAYEIFNVYKTRLGERIEFIITQLENEFDYNTDEYIQFDRSEEPWAKTIDEINNEWRKRLKNDALNRTLDDKDWDDISESLTKRYKSFHKTVLKYNSEDVFQLYLNAFGETIEPHTSYFSPITAENFGINMSLSLEGIGALLVFRNDYTTITRIIPGGPADKSKKLKANDRITAVAQGEDGEFVDVIGWRIDDVIQLIRGKKGTTVRLQILDADAVGADKPFELVLVRDKIKLEEQAAQKDVLHIEEEGVNYTLGVIDIPSFYIDLKAKSQGDPNYKSTTRDVKKLIDSLKTEKVDGIIIDLRRNGGGSLQEAIELTGLFIKNGPVVQVKDTRNSIEIAQDPDFNIIYDGPLAVLVDRSSASASEIFSAAIQDYGRGIILGTQTFGKGTVQNLIGLDRFMPSSKDKLGELKMTIAKFYRIDGSSTQKKGVIPDIEYPSAYSAEKYGEASRPSALKWDRINSAQYTKYGDIAQFIPELTEMHKERIESSTEFQYYIEDVNDALEAQKKKSFSLNKEVRKKGQDEREAKRTKREEEREKNKEIKIEGDEEVATQTSRIEDPLLQESAHILANLIKMKIG